MEGLACQIRISACFDQPAAVSFYGVWSIEGGFRKGVGSGYAGGVQVGSYPETALDQFIRSVHAGQPSWTRTRTSLQSISTPVIACMSLAGVCLQRRRIMILLGVPLALARLSSTVDLLSHVQNRTSVLGCVAT